MVDRLSDTNPEDRAVDELYPCERCGMVYNTEDDLESHVKIYHESFETCMFCNFKGATMDLIDHVLGNCGIEQKVSEPEENCQECCEVFDTVDSLMTHVEKYHDGSFLGKG